MITRCWVKRNKTVPTSKKQKKNKKKNINNLILFETYKVIIIIIIKSRCKHGFPCLQRDSEFNAPNLHTLDKVFQTAFCDNAKLLWESSC